VRVDEHAPAQRQAPATDAVGEVVTQARELFDARVEVGVPPGREAVPVLGGGRPVAGQRRERGADAREGMPTRWDARTNATRRSVSRAKRRWFPGVRRLAMSPSRS
jgi:hypothetical protein